MSRVSWTFLVTTLLVTASSSLLPIVGGYGTVLYQYVSLYGWKIVASAASTQFADTHRATVWTVAAFLAVVVFVVPAAILWLVSRNRRGAAGSVGLVAWCILYLAGLFALFPASDGP
jgi:hypothetical protein